MLLIPAEVTRVSTIHRLALAAVLAFVAGACGGAPAAPPKEPFVSSAEVTRSCPLGVPSTRIRIADTPGGVDVAFATSSVSSVDELRRRVHDQARANGPNRHLGEGHRGRHAGAHDHGLQLWSMGELRTSVADTPGGATLSIAPADPSRAPDVRRRVIQRVALLESRGCHE